MRKWSFIKTYKELLKEYRDIELVASKKSVRFIEQLVCYSGIEISHEDYKSLVYGDKHPYTQGEQFVKSCYDAYKYLLNNRKTEIAGYLLKRYYFILTGQLLQEDIIIKIQSTFYKPTDDSPIERIIDLHFSLYEIFSCIEEKWQKSIAFTLLNYLFYSHDLLPLKLLEFQYKDYDVVKEQYLLGNKIRAYEFFIDIMVNEKVAPKSYYDNLEPIKLEDIYDVLNKEKSIIKNLFSIETISVFGSFSRGDMRIDSDIDLLVTFMPEITYEDKMSKIDFAKDYLTEKFKRFVDIQEFNKFILEKMVHEIKNIKKVF